MSDVIARMRLESQDFDNKLKSATANLQHMEREVRRTGATFEYADKEELAFLQSLGSMETKAMDAKGKIKELSNSYKELAMMYERMTDAEKKSDGGRALASSLQQLKTRLNDTKASFANVSKEIGEGGGGGLSGALQTLGSKIGIPAGAFTALGGAMAAGAAAAKVVKDAFLNTEAGIDEWGRTVEGAKGAYSVFLDTLNNGNWSSFFTNLGNAITGARKLYDEMDRLGSIKANNAAAIAKEQATIQELRLRQQKGENVAAELRAAEERLRKLQAESSDQGKLVGREQMKQAITNSANSIKGNGASFLGINFKKDTTAKVSEEAIDAAIDEILNTGQAAMDKYKKAFDELQAKGTKTVTNYSQGGQVYYTKEFDITTLSAEEQALYKLSKAVTDSETKLQAGIQTYTSALQEEAGANREAFQAERYAQKGDRQAAAASVKSGTPLEEAQKKITSLTNEALTADEERKEAIKQEIAGLQEQVAEYKKIQDYVQGITKQEKTAAEVTGPSGYSEEGISALRKQMQDSMKGMQVGSKDYIVQAQNLVDLTAFENLLKTAVANGIELDPTMLEGFFESIDTGAFNIEPAVSDEAWETFVDAINEKLAELDLPPIELNVKTGNVEKLDKQVGSLEQNLTGAINVFGQLGDAMQQIDDPGAKVAGIIMGAIANIAGTFAASLKGTFTPWDWIAAAISGTAVMVSTIAAIKSATSGAKGYAEGGMVGGNSYSGDNIVARLNSGEGVLTAQGVQNAAAMANSSNPMQNLQLSTEISGTNLRIVMNNDNRSKGGSRGYYANIH